MPACVAVDLANQADEIVTAGKARIDPIPGEVAQGDRRKTRRLRGRNAQRRQVGHHVRGADALEPAHFVIDARGKRGHECPRAFERGGFVEGQAVDLHHAGVAGHRRECDARPGGAGHQPRRHLGADDDAGARLSIHQCVDDFNRPRGMAKTVAGNVEGDGHGRDYDPGVTLQ